MGEARTRVAVVNDYATVVEGLAGALASHTDQVAIVDGVIVGRPLAEPVDVALYDTFGQAVVEGPLGWLRSQPEVARVIVRSMSTDPALVARAQEAGAAGFVGKGVPTADLVVAMRRVATGEAVVELGDDHVVSRAIGRWPGESCGLSEREAEVCALAAGGLTNAEIGAVLFLGRETVKTHLSSAYRKLGIRNRVQVAAWVQRAPEFRRFDPQVPA